jgi:hypothetical protein
MDRVSEVSCTAYRKVRACVLACVQLTAAAAAADAPPATLESILLLNFSADRAVE